jgi:hypothetical protein
LFEGVRWKHFWKMPGNTAKVWQNSVDVHLCKNECLLHFRKETIHTIDTWSIEKANLARGTVDYSILFGMIGS